MKKILFKIDDLVLGALAYDKNKYVYVANNKDILKAKKAYPLEMRFYKLNIDGAMSFDILPYPFNEYLSYTAREDLSLKAGITSSDSDFDRLYKLAGLDIAPYNRFTIIQG